MKYALLMLLFFLPAFAQETVKPVWVSITVAEGDELALQLTKEIRARLPKNVILGAARPDWRLTLAVVEDKCGFIAALVVTDKTGASQLSIHTSDKLETLAAHLVTKIQAVIPN